MRLGTAIECLVDNYKYASDKEWINDKVAWALYHTWKVADRKTENSSEKPNNCETEPTGYNLTPVEDEPQKWTKENCKGCKYNESPYDSGTCFVRVCINGNKYEPKE